eukprot:jgi/Mesvir1/19579/Mv09882-RA.1
MCVKAAIGDGGHDPIGEIGARDPFAAEIESNFSDKVLGNSDTMHKIKIPDINQLVKKKCVPCEAGAKPLDNETAKSMLKQGLVSWELVFNDAGNAAAISRKFEVKGFKSGLELFGRIGEIANAEGHHPDLHLENYSSVRVVLSTHAVKGLTENDYIVAAKIEALNVSDLLKKKQRFWA